MNGSNLGLSHMYAASRHAEFVAEAERERLIGRFKVRGGSDQPNAIGSMRMRVGTALIRIGEKLHGTVDERCPDLDAGSLRPVRS
jgi:hypothetical protein